MRELLDSTRNMLREHASEDVRESTVRFFKDDILAYGVKGADMKRIARQVWAGVKKRPKAEIVSLCDTFWESGYMEEGGLACEVAYALRKSYEPEDFALFNRWLDDFVRNWAHCDMLCTRSVAAFIDIYPERAEDVKAWAHSGNSWKKRAAAVSFVPSAKKGKYLETVFDVADAVLADPDDMVQKGYGWALKVAGEAHPDAVFTFLMERRTAMPRTAFRYALEKLPPAMRARAMEK